MTPPLDPSSLGAADTSRDAVAQADALFASLYRDLHRLARREAARGAKVALGATTLLHEAYVRLSGRQDVTFADTPHFLAYACRVMRGLVIDHVRRGRAVKRGRLFHVTALDTTVGVPGTDDRQLQRISDVLDELAAADPASAEIVDLKFFCGFSFVEIARMRGVSERTVQRQWEKARLYLHTAMGAALPAA